MKRSELKEKIKRSVCLFFAAVLILSITLTTGNAFAADTTTYSPYESARIKLYYKALRGCLGTNAAYNKDGRIDKSDKTAFFAGDFNATVKGALLEEELTREYHDGQVKCGENNNALLREAISVLKIGTVDNLICDYQNPDDPAIYRSVDTTYSSCISALNAKQIMVRYYNDNGAMSYLERLVQAKTGIQDLDNLTSAEQYALYTKTFTIACVTDKATARLDDPDRYEHQVMIYNTATGEFVRAGFPGQSGNPYLWHVESKSCNDIANALDEGGSLYSAVKDYLVEQLSNGVSTDSLGVLTEHSYGGTSSIDDDLCYDKAGVLGWILCPVISTASGLLSDVYESIENDFLQIDAVNVFKRRNDGGIVGRDPVPDSNLPDESTLHIIWATFRDIANIGFVIFMLIVILSQVTGWGIDNYGIKKMLPRIIIAAIIVNLSYFICEAAVDLSNIIGVGIKDVFNNFSTTITLNSTTATGSSGVQNVVVMGSLLSIGVIALLVSPGLILTLVVALVSMAISVLFLWIILIVRQAGLILAVGISPLAFLCYLLPNTERLYKRWIDLMKGLLLLYPICAFVIGGGLMAGKIFASMSSDGTNAGLTLAAMIVPVIPYLFIPSLLRGSLKAMGNLGATINRLGRTVNNGTVGKFRKSEAAKRMRTSMNTWDVGGIRSRVSATKFGRYTGLQQSSARKIAAREKMKNDDRAAQALLQRERFARLEQRDPKNVTLNAFEAQLDDAMTSANGGDRYDAILSEIERRFGASKAADLAMSSIDKNQNSALLSSKNRQEFMRKLAQNHQATFAKTPDFGKYLQYGGVHRNSVTGATTHTSFAGVNADTSANFLSQDINIGDFKDSQIAAAGSRSVARLTAGGKLAQADANRIMSNDEIRGSMDSVQQLILAAHGNRNNYFGVGHAGYRISKEEAEAILAGRTNWTDEHGVAHTGTQITQAQANALIS